MSLWYSERSGSSQGRGGNTQQEHHLISTTANMLNLSEEVRLTSHRRKTTNMVSGENSQFATKLMQESKLDEDTCRVLEDLIRTYSPSLAERDIVNIIAEYDVRLKEFSVQP